MKNKENDLHTQDIFTGTKFERPIKKRAKHRKLAHVVDAGEEGFIFECLRCDWRTDWINEWTPLSMVKKGIPCPYCNQ